MMKHDVFISYASRDRETARKVCATLEAVGVACWIAPRNIPFGADYASSLIDAIGKSYVVISIFSSNTNRSSHVRREIERAASKDKSIIVFRCEQVPFSRALEYFLSDSQWIDAAAESLEEPLCELRQRIPSIVREAKTRAGYAGTLDDRVDELREISLEEHDRAVAVNPDDPCAWYDRAFARFQKSDNLMAIADCNQALELDVTMADAFNLRGMACFNLSRYGEALHDLNEALRLSPDYTMAFILKGIIHTNQNDFESAISEFDRAIELLPGFALQHELRAQACISAERYQDAVNSLSIALELDCSDCAELLRRRAVALEKTGQIDAAVKDFDQALELRPSFAEAWRDRGQTYLQLLDYPEALRNLDHASSLSPADARIYSMRCLAQLFTGQLDAALSDANQAVGLGADDGHIYWVRGHCYLKRNEPGRALDELNDAVRRGCAEAVSDRGLAYLQTHQPDRAIQDYDEVVRMDPANDHGYANRGAAHLMLNNYAAALADLNRAIGLNPSAASSYRNRALARQGLGDLAGAQQDRSSAEQLAATK